MRFNLQEFMQPDNFPVRGTCAKIHVRMLFTKRTPAAHTTVMTCTEDERLPTAAVKEGFREEVTLEHVKLCSTRRTSTEREANKRSSQGRRVIWFQDQRTGSFSRKFVQYNLRLLHLYPRPQPRELPLLQERQRTQRARMRFHSGLIDPPSAPKGQRQPSLRAALPHALARYLLRRPCAPDPDPGTARCSAAASPRSPRRRARATAHARAAPRPQSRNPLSGFWPRSLEGSEQRDAEERRMGAMATLSPPSTVHQAFR
ncbi:PREDICTED: uncharacterized protein LOC102012347 [Chinchilla lanigera]|uniref:uncharacterized protein LOC102012347 n=1 Tax=Chinchilla lanigera TaxID=34839 RepID=UPI00038ECB1B|nr:PREDICTED: uncharacterized protein LOC102012347 [Chinchilla lanigera]